MHCSSDHNEPCHVTAPAQGAFVGYAAKPLGSRGAHVFVVIPHGLIIDRTADSGANPTARVHLAGRSKAVTAAGVPSSCDGKQAFSTPLDRAHKCQGRRRRNW